MSPRPATSNADRDRQIGDIARMGVIESVDLAAARVTVAIGDLVTGPLPWLAMRAGSVKIWAPPSAGEQVLVIFPEGDIAAGVVLPGIYCEDNAAPTAEDLVWIEFADGSKVTFDHESHELSVVLPVDGKLRVVGDIEVTGKITASEDVLVGPVSLKDHVHLGVTPGGGLSQKPQALPL